ncbi:putative DNA binding domain-containing protein [bacterium]|nr:putative DNA binding domain-containing protein [bacterium]
MIERIKKIIKNGEKTEVEFKAAQGGMPRSVYETVCSFLNTKGGEIVLGVDDNRNIIGIPSDKINAYKKDFTSEINNPQKLFPTTYLSIEEHVIDDKHVLYINVPEGSQVYKCDGKTLIRNFDGDFDITNNQNLLSSLYLRKSSTYSENKVFPYMTMDDLDENIINKVRQMAVNRTKNHPWATMDNLSLLKSASLYRKDYSTQQEGFTLACALLFGKDLTIQNLLPHYRTDLIFKTDNEIRYSDRDTVETNLIDSYDRIMRFVEKHLPSPFYLEKDIRIDIRNAIFRELAVNTLMHREFTLHNYARFIIEPNKILIENANKPYICGNLKPKDFRPYTKNPTIAKIFKEIGYAEELGSGVRNVMKYSMEYFGSEPDFIDETLFRTIVNITNDNLITHVVAQNEQVNVQVDDTSEQVSVQVDDTSEQVSVQVNEQLALENMIIEFCSEERSLGEILKHFRYKSRGHFKTRYLDPLIKQGTIGLTNPNSINSPTQKYYTTSKRVD